MQRLSFCFSVSCISFLTVNAQQDSWSNCSFQDTLSETAMEHTITAKGTETNVIFNPGFRDIKVAVECGYNLYTHLGSDKEVVRWYIYHLVDQVSDVYLKEFNAHVQVSYIEIDTVPENYSSPNAFVTKWETNKQSVLRDFTHYITSAGGGSVGLTTTSCLPSKNYALSYEYSKVNMMDLGNIPPQVFAHEMGHNLGGIHPHDAIGNGSCQLAGGVAGDIMTYCPKRDLKYWYKSTVLKTKIACYPVISAAPPAPDLLAPGQVSAAPFLFWKPSHGATGYTIQVASDNAFLNIVYQKQVPVPVAQVQDLLHQTYYWRVKASNDYGTSSWSNNGTFTVNKSPKWPTAKYPENLSKNVPEKNLRLEWSAVPGATQYEVQVTYIKYCNTFNQPLLSETVSATSVSLASLTQEANWNVNRHNILAWRVRVAGGSWSPVYSFKPVPAAPVLVFPAAAQTQVAAQGIVFKWKSDFRETVYQSPSNAGIQYDGRAFQELQVATDAAFNNVVVHAIDSSLISGLRDAAGQSKIQTKTVNLQQNTQYYWRVRVGCNNALSGWPTEMPDWTSSFFRTSGPLGVPEKDQVVQPLLIFPNPSGGSFTVHCLQAGMLKVMDMLGRTISDAPADSARPLEFHNLSKGIYFIQLTNPGKNSFMQRIIVTD